MAAPTPVAVGAVFLHPDTYRYLPPLPWLEHVDVDLRWWLGEYFRATTVVVRASQLASPSAALRALASAIHRVRGCDVLLLGLAGHLLHFQRRAGDVSALALPASLPGRPGSALPLSSIAATVRESLSAAVPVVVCADFASATGDTALDGDVGWPDAGRLHREWRDMRVVAAATMPQGPHVTCHNALAHSLGELALAGKPALVDEAVDAAIAKLRESGVAAVATGAGLPDAVIGPVIVEERLADFVRADLCSFDPGSRLDAVAELAELADAGNSVAARHLGRLRTHDPASAVRGYAESALRRTTGPSVAKLAAAGVIPGLVYDQAKAVTDIPELVTQPSGWVSIGVDWPDGQPADRPRHPVHIHPFRLARTPTTNRQYLAYVIATDSICPPHWTDNPSLWLGPDLPVVMVSWSDAAGYCAWLTRHLHRCGQLPTHRIVALPTEAEWECAASNARADRYPWGNDADPARANIRATGINAVIAPGTFSPAGDSDAGCQDLIGNVWEWTSSVWGSAGRTPRYAYPYQGDDGREDGEARHDVRYVIRGGAYYYATECANSFTRNQMPAHRRHPAGGFRVACRDPYR